MFKPTYLYIKTHNKTGLKYFGKTTSKDPHQYTGSGKRWLNHIRKHGYDVTTEIYGYYTNQKQCLHDAIEFSNQNNIVESPEWANLKIESLDGGWSKTSCVQGGMITKQRKIGIHGLSREENIRNSKKANQCARKTIQEKYGVQSLFSIYNTNPEMIEKKKATFKKIKHQQGEKNSQYGTCWISFIDPNMSKRIPKNLLPLYIDQGWIKGRNVWNRL